METEALKIMHEETLGQPRELFVKQMIFFRKIMCSTEYTQEYKEKAYGNLVEVYARCNLTQGDIDLFSAVTEEFEMRSKYELFHPRQDANSGENDQ